MAKIHNGFFDKRFHDTFKNSNINDTDMATTKFYNRPKYLYEHLGFDGVVYEIIVFDAVLDTSQLRLMDKYLKNVPSQVSINLPKLKKVEETV